MEVSELKIFLAVARNGSISRAAEELHCVQSNVTTRLKQMEERLGVALFHRKSKGVVLTHSGLLLMDYAERIVRLSKEAEDLVSDQDEPKGKLRVGTMETTAAVRLTPLMINYHQLYPRVELSLETGSSLESLKRLLNFRIDGAFVAGEITHNRLIAEKAFAEELVLVTASDITSLEQIENLKILVFRDGCSYREQLEEWLRRTGKLPYRIVEFGSLEGIMGCVAAGMGVSFLPRSVVQRPQYQDHCSFHRLPEDISNMTTWFVRRRDEVPGKAMQAFMDLIGLERG
ncbi:LysR family transcriptional regulator [Pelobacter seleniigenes]|uniref:LysR family transcriptional regulator n=1 Tax=Pelobacter seleniigenes TaxID=407188 RepID=UPI0004A6F1B7|nr:LysR family transcriptional regulator [Pelobacter seleniigenes]